MQQLAFVLLYSEHAQGWSDFPRCHLPKAFKSKRIDHRSLRQGIAIRTNNRQLEKPEEGREKERRQRRIGNLETPTYTGASKFPILLCISQGCKESNMTEARTYIRELKRPHTFPKLNECSESPEKILSFHL